MALVFEDDFQLLDQGGDFMKRLKRAMEQLPEDWEVGPAAGWRRLRVATPHRRFRLAKPAAALRDCSISRAGRMDDAAMTPL